MHVWLPRSHIRPLSQSASVSQFGGEMVICSAISRMAKVGMKIFILDSERDRLLYNHADNEGWNRNESWQKKRSDLFLWFVRCCNCVGNSGKFCLQNSANTQGADILLFRQLILA